MYYRPEMFPSKLISVVGRWECIIRALTTRSHWPTTARIFHILKTRSTQRAQTSAERQRNRLLNDFCRESVLCVLTTWQFFSDPDGDPEWTPGS